jgi:DNA ligase-1
VFGGVLNTYVYFLGCGFPQYPDVVHLVHQLFSRDKTMKSFIMDAEIVAVDAADGTLKTFQELSNRARKDVKADAVSVGVCIFAFDLMYLDGQVRSLPSTLGL